MSQVILRSVMVLVACALAAPAVPSEAPATVAAVPKKKKANKKPPKRKKANKRGAKRKKATKRPGKKRPGKRPPRRKNNKKRPMRKKAGNKKAKADKRPNKKRPGAPANKTVKTIVRDWKGTQKLIAGHKGKIVVVDFWATWCKPCVKELPGLIALQKRYPKDVVAITYNADNDGTENINKDVVPRVVKVLKRLKAAGVINVVSKQTDEETYEAVGIDSVPTIFVFGRDGKLAKKIDVNSAGGKDVSYEKHVLPVVKKLIAEK